jgi:hypothetical protein
VPLFDSGIGAPYEPNGGSAIESRGHFRPGRRPEAAEGGLVGPTSPDRGSALVPGPSVSPACHLLRGSRSYLVWSTRRARNRFRKRRSAGSSARLAPTSARARDPADFLSVDARADGAVASSPDEPRRRRGRLC